jgi:hypothetical protein
MINIKKVILTAKSFAADKFLHNYGKVFRLRVLYTLVDYIRGALLHAKLINLSKELRDDLLA